VPTQPLNNTPSAFIELAIFLAHYLKPLLQHRRMGKFDHQPDKGGKKRSAKAIIQLPFAQPAASQAPIKPSSSNITTSTTDPYKAAREALDRDGFVVLSASLFPSFDLDALRAAASRMTEAARSGKWPYIRTLPKQFPPWPQDPSNGIWGVQHLLHPSNADHLTFAKSYFDAELLRYVAALIGCAEDDLTMELYNMLVRPDKDFSLRWHRDDVAVTATPEEEVERLKKPSVEPCVVRRQQSRSRSWKP
jgi:hypothetical protein